MKPNRPNTILIGVLFLLGCGSMQLSQDEVEYQKFVAQKNSNNRVARPIEGWSSTYKESGLQDYIFGLGTYADQKDRSLSDLDKFYKEVILERYAVNEYQEGLKMKFVDYAVSAFNLTQKKNAEATQHLVNYSRELIKNKVYFDPGLFYTCISNVKGLVDEMEYGSMVKKCLFEVRFGLELFEKSLSESKVEGANASKTAEADFRAKIEEFKQHQINFEALIVN
jgi:hypothetical protein